MHDNLTKFIDHARQQGMDHAVIFQLLRSGGWKEKEIAAAIAAHDLALPIPERTGIGTARDAFLHLLAFTALYAWAVALILLLLAFIDFAFPDPEIRVPSYAIDAAMSGVRTSLATLIVAYPLFLLVWGFLLHEVRASPESANSAVRRWLTSLTLFVGAVTIMTDVITVVYRLVEGDLTTPFLLKVLVLAAVTGALFTYLALTLRSEAKVAQ